MTDIKYAIKQIIPISFAYIFVGIAFGVLMVDQGFSPAWSFFASLFIYAGSMQLIMVPLLVAGVPFYTLAIMTFLINARHIFYGIGFIERFKSMGKVYPYMALTLTDEVFSVLCSTKYPPGVNPKRADFFISFFAHMLWVVSASLGALAGQLIPWDMTGIEFSATAFFTVVVVNQWMEAKSKLPAITGLISALVFLLLLGPDKFLLPALSVSFISLIFLRDRIIYSEGRISP